MAKTRFLSGHSTVEVDYPDSPEAADARVALKLAATGYYESRHGSDAGGPITATALFQLRGRAIFYYARLHRVDPTSRLPPDLGALHEDPLVASRFCALQVASLAYGGTRVGSDAHSEFTRAAIGELCRAAVQYTEALLQESEQSRREDRTTEVRRRMPAIELLDGDPT